MIPHATSLLSLNAEERTGTLIPIAHRNSEPMAARHDAHDRLSNRAPNSAAIMTNGTWRAG
jgi:hypothetical protein